MPGFFHLLLTNRETQVTLIWLSPLNEYAHAGKVAADYDPDDLALQSDYRAGKTARQQNTHNQHKIKCGCGSG